MPTIAYGTWTLGNGQGAVDQVDQALSLGFDHVGESEALYCGELILPVLKIRRRATEMKKKRAKRSRRVVWVAPMYS